MDAARHETARDFSDIPAAMRSARRWLVWREEAGAPGKKPRKVPYYVNGARRAGTLDSPDDMAKFGDFDAAVALVNAGPYAGLGFALGPDGIGNCWQGVDRDDLPNRPELAHIADDLPGYTETSPSGKGLHAIGYGAPFPSLGSDASGIEAFATPGNQR